VNSDGEKHFYEGNGGQERLVKVEYLDGRNEFWQGGADKEYQVLKQNSCGKKEFCPWQCPFSSHYEPISCKFVVGLYVEIPEGAHLELAMPLSPGYGHVKCQTVKESPNRLLKNQFVVTATRTVSGDVGFEEGEEGVWPIWGIVLMNGFARCVKSVDLLASGADSNTPR
jgi:hypothetical protein